MEPVTWTLVGEAAVVGLVLIVLTYVVSIPLSFMKPSLPEVCASWNSGHIMELTLFLAGFLFHFLFEITGINRWYVEKKAASLRQGQVDAHS